MSKVTNESNQLQFLRFLAFVLICIFHTGNYQFSWLPDRNGAANAVEFFILLSGVVSGISSYDKEIHCSINNVFAYIKKKIVKVYPLYFVTTIFTVTYSSIPSMIAYHDFDGTKDQLCQLVKNLLLIQSWFPTNYFSYNAVGWFLSTIMFLYFINVPLRAIATKIRNSKNSEWVFVIIVAVSYLLIWLYCYLTRNTNMEYTQYVLPVSRVGEYICGMALGYLICSLKKKIIVNRWVTVFFTALEAIAIGLWIYGMYIPMASWHFRITHWLAANIFMITIFSVGKGAFSSLFRLSVLRYLGDISFECFLIHQIVIHLYRTMSGLDVISKLGNLFSMSFCLLLTIMVASLISDCKIKMMSN